MKKSDLKTGRIIELRNGQLWPIVVLDGAPHRLFFDGLDDMLAWDEDLINLGGVGTLWDVVRVHRRNPGNLNSFDLTLIWDRQKEETPILTLDGVDYSETTLRSLIKKATK